MNVSLNRLDFERVIALLTAELRYGFSYCEDPNADAIDEEYVRDFIDNIDAKMLHPPVFAPTAPLTTRRLTAWYTEYTETNRRVSKVPNGNNEKACSLQHTSEEVTWCAKPSASQHPSEAEVVAVDEVMAIVPSERRFERVPVPEASDQALLLTWTNIKSFQRDTLVQWQLRATQCICELFNEMRRIKRRLATNKNKRIDRLEALITGRASERVITHDRELDDLEEEEERLVCELDNTRSIEAHLRAMCESIVGVGLLKLQPGKLARWLFVQQQRRRLRREMGTRFGDSIKVVAKTL